ncbi:hypothetical protein AVEN_168550-1 [Araneus ventricosus]|uniref:Uncharacterized protein n=1 Tax=Araneus ventricosus TaxID=182803 RepID=A0A4Y2FR46_ARAVE|nr:hypothetical protein AVEN_168550-1 [Araneus ventricosus]
MHLKEGNGQQINLDGWTGFSKLLETFYKTYQIHQRAACPTSSQSHLDLPTLDLAKENGAIFLSFQIISEIIPLDIFSSRHDQIYWMLSTFALSSPEINSPSPLVAAQLFEEGEIEDKFFDIAPEER